MLALHSPPREPCSRAFCRSRPNRPPRPSPALFDQILWDAQGRAIVSNESADILRILNSALNDFAANPSLDHDPAPLRAEIDAVNAWVYDGINNGVYKCGFAKSQAAYDAASAALLAALELAEAMLTRQRYLVGNVLTEADVRLFMTLIRFDPVYVAYVRAELTALN